MSGRETKRLKVSDDDKEEKAELVVGGVVWKLALGWLSAKELGCCECVSRSWKQEVDSSPVLWKQVTLNIADSMTLMALEKANGDKVPMKYKDLAQLFSKTWPESERPVVPPFPRASLQLTDLFLLVELRYCGRVIEVFYRDFSEMEELFRRRSAVGLDLLRGEREVRITFPSGEALLDGNDEWFFTRFDAANEMNNCYTVCARLFRRWGDGRWGSIVCMSYEEPHVYVSTDSDRYCANIVSPSFRPLARNAVGSRVRDLFLYRDFDIMRLGIYVELWAEPRDPDDPLWVNEDLTCEPMCTFEVSDVYATLDAYAHNRDNDNDILKSANEFLVLMEGLNWEPGQVDELSSEEIVEETMVEGEVRLQGPMLGGEEEQEVEQGVGEQRIPDWGPPLDPENMPQYR